MYGREIRGRTLTFGVSGKLYRNSLIMFDRETDSLWSHLLGAAVEGPMRGAQLEMIPSTFTTWDAWRDEHPSTLALSPGLSPYGLYSSAAYGDYVASDRTGILGTRRRDERLRPKDLVLGVLAPAAKAYALGDLRRHGTIRDTLAGETVEIVYDDEAEKAEAFLIAGDARELLPSTPIFWFAWVDFFPRAPLWEGDARSGARAGG